MENKMKSPLTYFILLIIVISMVNIYNHLDNVLQLTNLLSLVGIFTAALYFSNNIVYRKLIYVWILFQLIVIIPYLDLSQVLSFNFFHFSFNNDELSINLNLIPFLYLGILKSLEISGLKGKTITFRKFREENKLGDIFPICGKILRPVALGNEKNWFLVELEKPIVRNGISYAHVLVRNKDTSTIKLNAKNQIAYFRLVANVQDLLNQDGDNTKFPFVDWVLCG